MKGVVTILIYVLLINFSCAQTTHNTKIRIDETIKIELSDSDKKIVNQLELLFSQIASDKIDKRIIQFKHQDLTIAVLKGLQGIKSFQNASDSLINVQTQLIKFYPISINSYSVSIAINHVSDKKTTNSLKSIMTLIAENDNGNIKFSIPMQYITKNWKSKKVENITYIYKDEIQLKRAHKFNQKNKIISKKFNVPTEQFKFYMCDNYQEILKLLGYDYQLESATTYKLGYGVEEGYIFSIMNNEDFSHDIFHYYSGKINDDDERNWIAEEGIACSWGNAYYTDKNGEMIELEELVLELKKHLSNTKADLLNLFENNTKIFNHIDSDLSVRSVISGVICNEIEDKKGIEGILSIINSGRNPNSLDAYFETLNDIIGINRTNFNFKISQLLKLK